MAAVTATAAAAAATAGTVATVAAAVAMDGGARRKRGSRSQGTYVPSPLLPSLLLLLPFAASQPPYHPPPDTNFGGDLFTGKIVCP